ncbi:hypothetical protein CK203_034538 [Vitis vinifera]|uniref:Uncharacterized protein n=1 Tax=Vitis vinifera TaxID=29760 RepID=A0A438IDM6_VITVI|nr:hypothetical protein CK203_034538 [Vitis vinifera]
MSGLGCLQRIKLDQCIPLDNSIDMFWQVMFPSWFTISVGYIIYLLMQTCSLAIICCYEARGSLGQVQLTTRRKEYPWADEYKIFVINCVRQKTGMRQLHGDDGAAQLMDNKVLGKPDMY